MITNWAFDLFRTSLRNLREEASVPRRFANLDYTLVVGDFPYCRPSVVPFEVFFHEEMLD